LFLHFYGQTQVGDANALSRIKNSIHSSILIAVHLSTRLKVSVLCFFTKQFLYFFKRAPWLYELLLL